MQNTLFLDTSGSYCSVGLVADAQHHTFQSELGRQHNERLLSVLDELFAAADISVQALDYIAFVNGPGSFTGVRMAATVSQALAVAANAKVVGIGTSVLWSSCAELTGWQGACVTSIRSRGDAYYLGGYLSGTPYVEEALVDKAPSWLFADPTPTAACGAKPPWWPAALDIPWQTQPFPVDVMVACAHRIIASGAAKDAAQAVPRYLTGDSPWLTVAERGRAQKLG